VAWEWKKGVAPAVVLGAIVAMPAETSAQCQTELSPTGSPGDKIGASIATDGSRAVVGAPNTAGGGAAYVYVNGGSGWELEDTLQPPNLNVTASFGTSVDIDGNLVVVGANRRRVGNAEVGAVFVYRRSQSGWNLTTEVRDPEPVDGDAFGYSVSLSGNRMVVGAPGADLAGNSSGKTMVYRKFGASWGAEEVLTGPGAGAGDEYGFAVSLSGNYAIVGAYGHDANGISNAGAAYIYRRQGSNWHLDGTLTASNGAIGDVFGRSVCISGDRAIVGAMGADVDGEIDAGAAYVFVNTGLGWTQDGILSASEPTFIALFGHAVAIDGEKALVSAIFGDHAVNEGGEVYVFEGAGWGEAGILTAPNAVSFGRYGDSVALGAAGAVAAVGVTGDAAVDPGEAQAVDLEPAPCPYDINFDCAVDGGDVAMVQAAMGPCPGCNEDLNGDGVVSFADILLIYQNWGSCN
jgi:hypothetical protein